MLVLCPTWAEVGPSAWGSSEVAQPRWLMPTWSWNSSPLPYSGRGGAPLTVKGKGTGPLLSVGRGRACCQMWEEVGALCPTWAEVLDLCSTWVEVGALCPRLPGSRCGPRWLCLQTPLLRTGLTCWSSALHDCLILAIQTLPVNMAAHFDSSAVNCSALG
jgi:hypothetical protein